MVLADISVNGIFSTPITFGLDDEEEDADGLASVVGEGISTSNAPEMSDADPVSSNSGNEADEDKEDTNNKDEDEDKEDKNNKDEEKENQDTTTTAPAVTNDDPASNSGEITRNNRDLEIEATAIRKKCEGASELDVDKVGAAYQSHFKF